MTLYGPLKALKVLNKSRSVDLPLNDSPRKMFLKKKNSKPKFKCSQCGEYHEEWPALGKKSPWHYHTLPEHKKEQIAYLNDDFCEIRWDDQTDKFIRTVLAIPVIDFHLNLEYGLWVSVSAKSYEEYNTNFDSMAYESGFFGWICNKINGYKDTLQIPTDVIVHPGTQRPRLKPHADHQHQLVLDFYNGISREEAESRIHEVIKNA